MPPPVPPVDPASQTPHEPIPLSAANSAVSSPDAAAVADTQTGTSNADVPASAAAAAGSYVPLTPYLLLEGVQYGNIYPLYLCRLSAIMFFKIEFHAA